MARIREEDEQTILLLLTEGVDILRSVGQVFSTAAFDGMMMPGSPTVKVGLSIDSNLVEISPIAGTKASVAFSPTKWVWENPCNCCHWWKLARAVVPR